MNATALANLLQGLRACSEARKWTRGKSLSEAWRACDRGDWMLWLCAKMIGQEGWPTQQQVVLAACSCAERSLKFVRKGDDRPRLAIETARRWARGEASMSEVQDDDAAAAAYAAAYAAADAAADDAAADDARKDSLRSSADIIRASISLPDLEEKTGSEVGVGP